MLKFIDTYYEKITWSIIVLGLISLFAAKDYLSLVIFLYLLIRAIKSRHLSVRYFGQRLLVYGYLRDRYDCTYFSAGCHHVFIRGFHKEV